MSSIHPQMVQQAGQIIHKGVAARSLQFIGGMSKSPVVKRNASITLGKVRDLLPPAKQVAARPVGKDDGVSLSISLDWK